MQKNLRKMLLVLQILAPSFETRESVRETCLDFTSTKSSVDANFSLTEAAEETATTSSHRMSVWLIAEAPRAAYFIHPELEVRTYK
jgi:hypothetical protein